MATTGKIKSKTPALSIISLLRMDTPDLVQLTATVLSGISEVPSGYLMPSKNQKSVPRGLKLQPLITRKMTWALELTQNVLRTHVCKRTTNLTDYFKMSGLSSCFCGPSRHRQPQLSTSIHLIHFIRLFAQDFSSPPTSSSFINTTVHGVNKLPEKMRAAALRRPLV